LRWREIGRVAKRDSAPTLRVTAAATARPGSKPAVLAMASPGAGRHTPRLSASFRALAKRGIDAETGLRTAIAR